MVREILVPQQLRQKDVEPLPSLHCGSFEFLSNDNYISAVFKLREMSAIGWANHIGNIERLLQ